MSGESSKRSYLIDITYQNLHGILCGQSEGVNESQLLDILKPRFSQLSSVSAPFGIPSPASREKITKGSVLLEDKVLIRLEAPDKEFIFAISDRFQIDQVQACVLFRSFLYNEGLPPRGADSEKGIVDELLEAITPFYYSERLYVLRTLIPLLRAQENSDDAMYELASEVIPKVLPDGRKYAESILKEYLSKTQSKPPPQMTADPRTASRWAKQNAKEQLLLLELLFWTMWEHAPCDGGLVLQIFQAAYSTNLGSKTQNSSLLLDDESNRIQQDCAGLWILITIEVLELENVAETSQLEISDRPKRTNFYVSSPDVLKKIHEIVTTNDGTQHACSYLAWAFVLSRIASVATQMAEVPDSYRNFLREVISPSQGKDREPLYTVMAKTCLDPAMGLFQLMGALLTESPLFVTSVAWRTGSSVTDPNAVAYRSVLKGLVIALVELVPVEMIPDFDGLVEVWIALFGRSESQSISQICAQYWSADWKHGIARRAIFDVARSRFPIHVRPLVRLLRAQSALGFLDTDPLSTADHSTSSETQEEPLGNDRQLCDRHVFFYMEQLASFSHVVPMSACAGSHALYERVNERYGSSAAAGLSYSNLRPVTLPGGSILPHKSKGTVLSNDGGDVMVVCWKHEHSGWRLILDILREYVSKRNLHISAFGDATNSFAQKRQAGSLGQHGGVTLKLSDIGAEVEDEENVEMIIDILDLLRSIMQDNPEQTEQLVDALESGTPVISPGQSPPPDLVQVMTMILESSLSGSDPRGRNRASRTRLITSAMSVLSALLPIPSYSTRVWLYIRSTAALFGSEKNASFASAGLAAERMTGHYTMTLALLHLVQRLFQQASATVLVDPAKLKQLKEEVLLRAVRFIHTEIWVEHLGWKYVQIGDRFEIGRRVASLYAGILSHSPVTLQGTERPFGAIGKCVVEVMLSRATTSAVNPLVSSLASGGTTLKGLYKQRRFDDARRLIFLLESLLHLVRVILTAKIKSNIVEVTSKLSLIEQSLCTRINNGFGVDADGSSGRRVDPINILAGYVKERDMGTTISLEAARVLGLLCASFSAVQPSPPSVIGHLLNAEATVLAFVRVVQHPYDDLALRNAVWHFITLAVHREPALATLFVAGKNYVPPIFDKGKGKAIEDAKGKGKEKEAEGDEGSNTVTALQIAVEVVENWKEMWQVNPRLLVSVMRFLDAVWQHGLEHSSVLTELRTDGRFWERIGSMAKEEMGPTPDYQPEMGEFNAAFLEGVAVHAYRTEAKAHALQILSSDLDIHLHYNRTNPTSNKPTSLTKMEQCFLSPDQFLELISEAAPSSYDPGLHDAMVTLLKTQLPSLTLDQLELQESAQEREYGGDFVYSTGLLQGRLLFSGAELGDHTIESIEAHLQSINLNLSLTHTQNMLVESWQGYVQKSVPFLRGNSTVRLNVLTVGSTVASMLAQEDRLGDMMATVYGLRLSLLLALLEVAWFPTETKKTEVGPFIELVKNVHGVIVNEPQSASRSFLGTITVSFHRTLLQIIYFCARSSRDLNKQPKVLSADQRLVIASMLEVALSLVVEALRVVFISARSRFDSDLDRDMELLVSVFEQCTWPDLNASPNTWLGRCQELDIIKASLELFVSTDLVGLSDTPGLLIRKNPCYAPHILLFHIILASIPQSAEKLANDGVLSAYSNNCLSSALSFGRVDVTIPELPGERSPAHSGYCSMLSVISAVVKALGRYNHYFDAEACGFVQLYGQQIARCLSWTINEPITLPLLEELEQTISLFHSIADSTSSSSSTDPVVEKVLKGFTSRASMLLQQINYALTHPNHLASLFEPVTAEERVRLEKESNIEDPKKRPLVGNVMQRMFRLSGNLLSTFVSVTRAFDVLLGDQDEWPVHEVLLVPHSKVVIGESASLGTLLELGNGTLDSMRDVIASTSAPKAIAPVPSTTTSKPTPELVIDAPYNLTSLRQLLEATLIYAVTQLAIFLSKPELTPDNAGGDMDLTLDDHPGAVENYGRGDEKRGPRQSLTLGERLKRGMTGEMVTDLQSLLKKAKSMIEKADGVTSKEGSKPIDLSGVLMTFLSEHTMA